MKYTFVLWWKGDRTMQFLGKFKVEAESEHEAKDQAWSDMKKRFVVDLEKK